MKKLFSFASLLCIMLFASCNSDVDDFDASVSGDKITISVGMPGADTRVSTADLLNLKWEDGDKIFLMGYDDNNKYLGRTTGYIQTGAGTSDAKFSVSKVDGATKYKIYYNNYVNRGPVTFDNNGNVSVNYKDQVRYKANESETIKETIILGSDFVPAANVEKGAYLKIRNSVLRLNIKNMHASQKGAGIANVTWKVNGNEAIYSPMADVKINEGQNNYFYFSFNPETDLSKNGTVEIVISANYSTQTASAVSINGKNYQPGKIYTITIENDAKGNWGLAGEPGGNEGGNDGKPVDPSVAKWANKTLWVEGLNVPANDKWSKPTSKSGYPIFKWEPGQGWYHCIKADPSTDHYCWAAASANMIYWWLDRNKENIKKYGKYTGPSVYNDCIDCEVFQYFKDHFTNKGLQIYYAMDWFFKGKHIQDNAVSNESAVGKWPAHTGFFKDVIPENKVHRSRSAATFDEDIKWMLTNKGIMGIGIHYSTGGTGAHALTVYGASFDGNGKVSEVYIVDNDMNEGGNGNTDPKLANPCMTVYKVHTDGNGVSWVWNSAMTKLSEIYSTVTITSNEAEWNAYFAKQNK